jgi:hypothetical protein
MTAITTARAIVPRAQEEESEGVALSEVPSTGAARPGPILVNVTTGAAPAEEVAEAEVPEGVAPVSFQIPNYGVDAPIEVGIIDNGVMVDPSGPWVIVWYEALGRLGQGTNVVVAGHVDYYSVGPAVLWSVKEPGLAPGEIISMTGEDGSVFEYAVEWSRQFHVATELTPEVIQNDIVNHTGYEAITIVTCGGEFDPATGSYVSRIVVRANQV